MAAGGLLIQEAGGIMGGLDEEEKGWFDIRNRKICATNGRVHEELREALKDAGVIRRKSK